MLATFPPAAKALLSRLKNRAVPIGARPWRLPLGIGGGLTIVLDLQHWSGLYLGLYEVELNRYLRELCRPGYRCFDVGGQNGYDALVLAKLSMAEVMTFECDQGLCDQMAWSVAANPELRDLVSVRHAFVGRISDTSRSEVALDDVAFQGAGFLPDFVKVDIEGGEMDALLGAQRILAERRPNLLIEVHSRSLEDRCGRLLQDAGYRPKVVRPRRWIRDNRPTEHNRWLIARGSPPQIWRG